MIRVFALCLVGTATVASADGYGFRTPTGNIYCNGAVTTSEIICSIVERHGPPAQPDIGACPSIWGHHIQLEQTGPARVICGETPRHSNLSAVAPYGESASLGAIVCRSERTGLQCTNPEGHGFFLSRRDQRIIAPSSQAFSRPTLQEIREAQEILGQLGYNPGIVDGLMGPNTARAISEFQAETGQPQTGTVSHQLVTQLRAAIAEPTTDQADLEVEVQAPQDTGDMARFDQDVFLLRFAGTDGGGSVHFSTANFEGLDPAALSGAIEGAIGAAPRLTSFRAQPADLALGALTNGAYAMVAGDWRNRITHALETNFSSVEYDFVQIARARDADADTVDETTDPAPAPLVISEFGDDDRPILRAWLPQYIAATSEDDLLAVFERYIVRLQGNRDYAASDVFAEGEIEGRQAGFLARSAYSRWRDALEAHSLTPPFTMRVRGTVRNFDYDFGSGALTLSSGYEDGPRRYRDSVSHRILRAGIIEAGGIGQRQSILGIQSSGILEIGLDREIPVAFPMDPARAERMINDRDIIVYDAALRITNVAYSESLSGRPSLVVDAEVLSVTVTTDAGAQIAAFSAQDMPEIAPPRPEPEDTGPVHDLVHLARPSDILTSVAASTGADPAALIESVYPSTSQDSFDRRDTIADLVAGSQQIDLGDFWMSGRGRLADYDYDAGEYGLDHVVLTYPDTASRDERGIRRSDLLRLSNVNQAWGVEFAMTERAARDLREGMRGSNATFRVRLSMDAPGDGPSGLPVTASIQEIVFVDPDSDPAVLDAEAVVARVSLTPPSDAGQSDDSIGSGADGESAAGGPEPYDILGVTVRQPLAAGLAHARATFGPQDLLYGRRDDMIAEGISQDATTPLMDSVTLMRNDGQDYLTVFHEPLVQDDPITGVARTMIFPEGARPTPDQIMNTLTEKYGETVHGGEDNRVFLWTRVPEAPPQVLQGEMSVGEMISQSTSDQSWRTNMYVCGRTLAAQASTTDHRLGRTIQHGGQHFRTDYPLVDAAGEPAPYPEAQPLWPLEVNVLDTRCHAELVFAVIRQDGAGLVSELRVFVTSRTYAPALAEVAEATLREQSVSEQTVPEIEF